MTELVSPEQHSAEAMAEQSNRQVTKLDTAFRQSSQEVAKVSGYCSCIVLSNNGTLSVARETT